ncbi:transposase [Enterobacter cancerogenus]|uniref:transposase n=1 Tax=Enterobacter cancerogenus TaxID=69218 RepID=UPI00384F1EA2
MESIADWRTESRTVYSNDFKLRIVELASHPDANVAKIARENGVAHNLNFKWLRMWQNESRVSTSVSSGSHRRSDCAWTRPEASIASSSSI